MSITWLGGVHGRHLKRAPMDSWKSCDYRRRKELTPDEALKARIELWEIVDKKTADALRAVLNKRKADAMTSQTNAQS